MGSGLTKLCFDCCTMPSAVIAPTPTGGISKPQSATEGGSPATLACTQSKLSTSHPVDVGESEAHGPRTARALLRESLNPSHSHPLHTISEPDSTVPIRNTSVESLASDEVTQDEVNVSPRSTSDMGVSGGLNIHDEHHRTNRFLHTEIAPIRTGAAVLESFTFAHVHDDVTREAHYDSGENPLQRASAPTPRQQSHARKRLQQVLSPLMVKTFLSHGNPNTTLEPPSTTTILNASRPASLPDVSVLRDSSEEPHRSSEREHRSQSSTGTPGFLRSANDDDSRVVGKPTSPPPPSTLTPKLETFLVHGDRRPHNSKEPPNTNTNSNPLLPSARIRTGKGFVDSTSATDGGHTPNIAQSKESCTSSPSSNKKSGPAASRVGGATERRHTGSTVAACFSSLHATGGAGSIDSPPRRVTRCDMEVSQPAWRDWGAQPKCTTNLNLLIRLASSPNVSTQRDSTQTYSHMRRQRMDPCEALVTIMIMVMTTVRVDAFHCPNSALTTMGRLSRRTTHQPMSEDTLCINKARHRREIRDSGLLWHTVVAVHRVSVS